MTYQQRAEDVLAQGTLTYSKRSDQFVKGVYPSHLKGGGGCFVTDSEGHGYVDWMGGLGSNLISCTNNWGLPSVAEVELAEKIRERVPVCEKLRILKTGSEACQAAVRIARAYQGVTPDTPASASRSLIWGTGYHGHHSVFISAECPGCGCFFEYYRKFGSVRELLDYATQPRIDLEAVAAVIVEPVTLSMDVKEELQELRDLCTKHGIVLIFDEIISGFRVPNYCVANYLGVQPDIICLGKALGNGKPLAIVGGKKEIMDTPGYFVSSTFAGELSSIVEALNVIETVDDLALKALWKRGQYFQDEFNKLTPKLKLKGIPTKAVWVGDELFRALFWQEMCKRGYLFGKAWHITLSHTWEIMDATMEVCVEVVKEIEAGGVTLEGEMPQEIATLMRRG